MTVLYLEDFQPGQRFSSAGRTVDTEDIKRFASDFDPQPFHLDEAAAAESLFQGLAASGWHTTALTMRLLVESDMTPANGIIGAGCDELRWPRPVRPGDHLRVAAEVLEVRESKSRPSDGFVKLQVTTLNQDDQPVQVMTANMLVPRRPAG